MDKELYFEINGAAMLAIAATGLIPTFGSVAIASGLVTAVGTGRGINSALNNGGSSLGLYVGRRFGHNILCGLSGQDGQGNGRNLHNSPNNIPAHDAVLTNLILPERCEKNPKHLVANSVLEGDNEKKLLGQSLSCLMVLQ